MTLALAISIFFGLLAAAVIAVCHASLRKAAGQFRVLRAEMAAMDHAPRTATVQPRQPQEAFARALALQV